MPLQPRSMSTEQAAEFLARPNVTTTTQPVNVITTTEPVDPGLSRLRETLTKAREELDSRDAPDVDMAPEPDQPVDDVEVEVLRSDAEVSLDVSILCGIRARLMMKEERHEASLRLIDDLYDARALIAELLDRMGAEVAQ